MSALPPAPAAAPDRPRPASLADLFVSFTALALQGFGGVLAVVQRELVERKRWLTQEEFIEDWAVAQIMPGPNVVNLSIMIGARWFGPAGALAAAAGLLALPLALVLLLAVLHAHYAAQPAVAGALRGMAAVSAGLIAAAGLRLATALANNAIALPWSIGLAVAAFVLLAWLRAPSDSSDWQSAAPQGILAGSTTYPGIPCPNSSANTPVLAASSASTASIPRRSACRCAFPSTCRLAPKASACPCCSTLRA